MAFTKRDLANLRDVEDLLTRTSWVNAELAHRQIKRGKAYGNVCALWVRSRLQRNLYSLGCFTQKHCGKVLFLGLLLLSLCCIGLKTATIETNVERLWVEEDGRLERELAYSRSRLGEGSGITSELVIQTPQHGGSVLSVESLLLHYDALLAASQVTVDMYDITWKFKDLCLTATFPSFDEAIFDRLLENLLPCIVITPLDCFWEGSKILGPIHGLFVPTLHNDVRWSNLHPVNLVKQLEQFGLNLEGDTILKLMERAGISSAYQEKPCLNPHDPQCPKTAPNKASKQMPDIGAELTGGCSGFATKYMHWEEDLIVGGITRNRTGYIQRADALQSVVQLLGEKELYDYYSDQYKVHSINWSQDKAKKILEAWQRKFTQEVARVVNTSHSDDVYPFSATSLMDILTEFSQVSAVRVALGYVLMLFYACVSLMKWSDAVQSQSGIGVAGVLLVSLSVAAGLGISSVLGINFNASTTQIIPFLALGLGVDDMFLLAHTFAEHASKDIPFSEQIGECLKRTGVSVLLTSVSNMFAFFVAAIIPIPALRAFALQAAILVMFNMVSMLLIFPAIVSIDMKRREEKRVDVFCCFQGSSANQVIQLTPHLPPECSHSHDGPPPPYNNNFVGPPAYSNIAMHNMVTSTGPSGTHPTTVLAPPPPAVEDRRPAYNQVCPSNLPQSTSSSRQCLTPQDGSFICRDRCARSQGECCTWSLTWLARRFYAPALEKTFTKVLVVVGFLALLIFGIAGTVRVQDGLDLTDLVPRDTNEYKFVEAQEKYFGFYNMYAVTMDKFDYPNNQQLIYEYHGAFQNVHTIIKRNDGSLPKFWLSLLRDWLLDLQNQFDKDVQSNCITKDTWYPNATNEGILAYKLLVQTGDIDNPVNKDQVLTNRLVDEEGIINKKAFYNYVTAWTSNDAMAYSASQSAFHPLPMEWYHIANDVELKIPKSQAFVYAQMPFYLNNLGDTQEITSTIEEIRDICDTFQERGLPNYPSGIPFTFWEQYINLRFYLMLSLICVLAAIFIVLTLVLVNPWISIIVVAVLAMMVVELFGFMGLIGIKLSAVPAVLLIVSVGIGVEFTVHISLGYLTSIGGCNRRMKMTLEHMFAPVIHGAVSTLLGVIMLCTAEFDFIVKYFFVVLSLLIVLGLLNGLVLLPVLLSIVGPPAEVIPLDDTEDRIPLPTPDPSPKPERPVRTVSRGRVYPRIPSDLSLSTITEEPTQYSSHEIVVQPEVVVETSVPGASIVTTNSSSSNSSPPSSSCSTPPSRHVTRVKASAKVKVEVHTAVPGSVEQDHKYKSKKRKNKESDFSDFSDLDSSSKC